MHGLNHPFTGKRGGLGRVVKNDLAAFGRGSSGDGGTLSAPPPCADADHRGHKTVSAFRQGSSLRSRTDATEMPESAGGENHRWPYAVVETAELTEPRMAVQGGNHLVGSAGPIEARVDDHVANTGTNQRL
jgi:hypothetical protein